MSETHSYDFDGIRILMIGIGFYDYEETIAIRLRERGATVFRYEDRPKILNFRMVAYICRFFPVLFRWLVSQHESEILRFVRKSKFDYVFVIRGDGISLDLIAQIKLTQKNCKFVLYLWDDLARLNQIEKRIELYDRVLTFDRKDAAADSRLIFRPLFFRPTTETYTNKSIDIAFVGWLHSDRLSEIRKIQQIAKNNGLKFYVYLYTGWITKFKLWLKGNAQDLYTRPMRYSNYLKVHGQAKCVLDFPHPSQTGMTMRAIEAMGLGVKLITTSKDVVNYDFYCKSNVLLIDDVKEMEILDFLEVEYSGIDREIKNIYSLDAWIDDVFCIELLFDH